MKKTNNKAFWLTQLLLFLFLMVYFTQITPLVPFDGDDWLSMGTMRLPFPMWAVFNPSKVLPEVLGPIVGNIAAFVVYPFSHDYIGSVTFVQAIVVSLFIVTMTALFFKLCENKLELSKQQAVMGELFFFMLFFLLFKHVNTASYTGFWATDYDCYFHYIIPGCLNASLVLYLMNSDIFSENWQKYSTMTQGLTIVMAYFAIFSSPQLSIITASYCLVDIFSKWISNLRERKYSVMSLAFLKKIAWQLIIILAWLVSIVFDLHGRRAAGVSSANQGSFLTKLHDTLQSFLSLAKQQNKLILATSLAIILLAVILKPWFKKNVSKYLSAFLYVSLICLVITFCYLVLAYSKAGSGYASRIDAMWGIIFYFILAVSISFISLLKNIHFVTLLTPLLLSLMILISFNFDNLPIPANVNGYDAQTAKRIDNYIINQIVAADRQGKSKVIVKVPQYKKDPNPKNGNDNWPHSYYTVKWVQNAMYSHRLIRHRMLIEFKPDKNVNKRYFASHKYDQPFTPLETK